MELSQLELQVLSQIKPKPEEYELVKRAFAKIAEAIEKVLAEAGVEAEVTLQGSIAHDTWLSGDRDLDVFVLFPGEWSREDLEKKALPLLIEAAKRLGSYELRYAEHPYVRVKLEEVEADLVPGLKLADPSRIKTAVDRTPFHTKYVNSVLTSAQRDHVRLLKKFMKAIGVYGAEVKTRGFSGYAVELLVAVYGGFREVLKEASSWKPPVFVNTLGDKLTPQLKNALLRKYPDSCIYMPDPVDPDRNVTANVSLKSLATFILAAKCYMSRPHLAFFQEPPEPSVEELLEALKGRCVLFLTYKLREKLPPDVIWGEAWRIASRLSSFLGVHDVKVVDYSAWTNEEDLAVVAVEVEQCRLPAYKHYRGPCIAHEEQRITSFLSKHARKGLGPWVTQDGCLESLDPRAFGSVAELLEHKWSEYSVAPHFRTVKPVIEEASPSVLESLIRQGGGKWLRDFVLKKPAWMEYCTS
jgi:tRNA nucleotidyltransferase (CCA-adding enzyme)